MASESILDKFRRNFVAQRRPVPTGDMVTQRQALIDQFTVALDEQLSRLQHDDDIVDVQHVFHMTCAQPGGSFSAPLREPEPPRPTEVS